MMDKSLNKLRFNKELLCEERLSDEKKVSDEKPSPSKEKQNASKAKSIKSLIFDLPLNFSDILDNLEVNWEPIPGKNILLKQLQKDVTHFTKVLEKLDNMIFQLENSFSHKFWLSKLHTLQMSWEILYWQRMALRYENLTKIMWNKTVISFLRQDMLFKRKYCLSLYNIVSSKNKEDVKERNCELQKHLSLAHKEIKQLKDLLKDMRNKMKTTNTWDTNYSNKEHTEINILQKTTFVLVNISLSYHDEIRRKETKTLRKLCRYQTNDIKSKIYNEQVRKEVLKIGTLYAPHLSPEANSKLNESWMRLLRNKIGFRNLQQTEAISSYNKFQQGQKFNNITLQIHEMQHIISTSIIKYKKQLKEQNDTINQLKMKIYKKIAGSPITNNLQTTKCSTEEKNFSKTIPAVRNLYRLERALERNKKKMEKYKKIFRASGLLIKNLNKQLQILDNKIFKMKEESNKRYDDMKKSKKSLWLMAKSKIYKNDKHQFQDFNINIKKLYKALTRAHVVQIIDQYHKKLLHIYNKAWFDALECSTIHTTVLNYEKRQMSINIFKARNYLEGIKENEEGSLCSSCLGRQLLRVVFKNAGITILNDILFPENKKD